jgi:hypothetical protein
LYPLVFASIWRFTSEIRLLFREMSSNFLTVMVIGETSIVSGLRCNIFTNVEQPHNTIRFFFKKGNPLNE